MDATTHRQGQTPKQNQDSTLLQVGDVHHHDERRAAALAMG
jgi:hypothetical protein